MTNTNKMTYVSALSIAIELLNNNADDFRDVDLVPVIEKLEALKVQTEKRNSADRKPTKAQVENSRLADVVLSVLTAEPATVTEIMARDAELAGLSNQKVSALVNGLVEAGKAVKTTEKRKSLFALAGE